MSPAGDVCCGVDIGTTNVKVLLLAADGTVLWRQSCPTPRVRDATGVCTDAEVLFGLVERMITDAHAGSGLSAPLRAICTGGVGEDGLPLDRALRPLDHAIAWNDRRAASQAERMAAEPLWSQARLPVELDATRTAAKWAWLGANRPQVVSAAACWVALTDFPAVRWSGCAFISETLAARTACYDTRQRAWVAALLKACGAPPLPPVLPGGTIVGPVVSGSLLSAGVANGQTMVVAGGHDHPMAASVVCTLHPGAVLDSMGTAELVYVEAPRHGSDARHPLFASSLPIRGDGTAWLGVLELSRILDPLLLGDGPVQELFRRVMAGAPVPGEPGAGGLRRAPWPRPGQIEAGPDLPRLRAALEGCAMLSRRLIEAASKLAGQAGPVFVSGGWARSNSFLQLRADVLGRPLHRLAEPQLSALGCAILAAQGVGGPTPRIDLDYRIISPLREDAELYDRLFESRPPEIEQ